MKYSENQHRMIVLFVISLLMWSCSGTAQDGKASIPNISPVYPHVLQAIEQSEPGERIQVFLATEKSTYVIGEPFEARFAVSEESYVVLMRIATDGTLIFLTPNRRQPDGKVQGNVVYSTGSPVSAEQTGYGLGLDLSADAPPGTEVLNLFCSPKAITPFDATALKDESYVVRPDDDAGLQAVLTWLEQLRQTEWAGTSVAFLVDPFPTPVDAPAPAPASAEDLPVPEKSSLFEKGALIPEAGTTLKAAPRKFGALRPMGGTGTTGKMFPIPGTNATEDLFAPEQ